MKKSEMREAAFMLIFEKLFTSDSCEEIAESARAAEEYEFSEESVRLFKNVTERAEELDGIIGEFSPKRKVARIGKVCLAVLRLGIYECLYEDEVPVNIAVSEAVHIAQKYTFENDVQFINGVLGAFARSGRVPENKTGAKV